MDIKRDGTVINTVSNAESSNNAYTDNIGAKGGGSYVYEVCEAGSGTCSPRCISTSISSS